METRLCEAAMQPPMSSWTPVLVRESGCHASGRRSHCSSSSSATTADPFAASWPRRCATRPAVRTGWRSRS
jgi:hypothetical protein